MCSLLVFSKPDNIHPDPDQQWTKFEAGDVIDVQDDDNFFWGAAIQGPDALGWWTVVSLPGVKAADVLALCMGDVTPDVSAPFRLRASIIDLDSLTVAAAVAVNRSLESFSAAQASMDTIGTFAPDYITDFETLMAFRSVKPMPIAPNVIGVASPVPVIG